MKVKRTTHAMTTADYFNLYRQAMRRCHAMPPAVGHSDWLRNRQAWLDAESLFDLYCSKRRAARLTA